MDRDAYRQFSQRLKAKLEPDPRVLGLVAVGSMAEEDYAPDRWSDHDFLVITIDGQQEALRSDLSWLPERDDDPIVLSYRETAHGLKIVYASGHLLEFAVFGPHELTLAKVNRYRVDIDRDPARIAAQLHTIAERTRTEVAAQFRDDAYLFNQFLTELLVGVGRWRRGERLSGSARVKASALRYLVMLVENHTPSPSKHILDGLDPLRRFETVYPALGEELAAALAMDAPCAAHALLDLAERELHAVLADYPTAAVAAVRRVIG